VFVTDFKSARATLGEDVPQAGKDKNKLPLPIRAYISSFLKTIRVEGWYRSLGITYQPLFYFWCEDLGHRTGIFPF